MGRYQSDGREIYGWSWEVSAFACQGARVEWSGYCYGEDPAYAAAEAIRVVPRVRAAAAVLRGEL